MSRGDVKIGMKLTLTPSMKMLGSMLLVYGGYTIAKYLYLIIVGVFGHTATGGSIVVTAAINTALNGADTTFVTALGLIDAGFTIVLGLVALVVIIELFKGWIFGDKKKSGKKSKGNSNF